MPCILRNNNHRPARQPNRAEVIVPKTGRKPSYTAEQIERWIELREKGWSCGRIARMSGAALATVQRKTDGKGNYPPVSRGRRWS